MRSRRRFNAGHGASRRRTTWARVESTVTLAATGDYGTTDLLTAFKADGGVTQGVTIARSHLVLAVEDLPDAGDQFAWGLIRGQNTDVGVNIAGAPEPVADPYEDWAMWELLTAGAIVGAGAYWPGGGNTWRYDIKAQRKIPELQQAWNAVFTNVSATTPFTIGVTGSILLLLP